MTRHAPPPVEPPPDVWLSDDPDLALVHADMHTWQLAHQCDCEAMCVCDAEASNG